MSSSQAMLMNQGLSMFDHHQEEEEEENNMSNTTTTQMGFFSSFPPSMSLLLPPFIPQSLKTLIPTLPPPSNSNILTDQIIISSSSKQRSEEDHINTSHLGGGPQLSLQRSSANLWAWGEVNECMSINKRSGGGVTTGCGGGGGGGGVGDEEQQHLIGVSAMKMKKINMKARRKVREPRFCFKTLSDVDVLDDGYKWRKYGQKVVKNTQHPRSYYRCTQDNCRVKKRVERLAEDPRMVITTYEGRHAHSPSHDEDDNSQAPNSLLDNFFF